MKMLLLLIMTQLSSANHRNVDQTLSQTVASSSIKKGDLSLRPRNVTFHYTCLIKPKSRSLDEMIPRARVCGESSEPMGYLEEDMHKLDGNGDSCIYRIKGTCPVCHYFPSVVNTTVRISSF